MAIEMIGGEAERMPKLLIELFPVVSMKAIFETA